MVQLKHFGGLPIRKDGIKRVHLGFMVVERFMMQLMKLFRYRKKTHGLFFLHYSVIIVTAKIKLKLFEVTTLMVIIVFKTQAEIPFTFNCFISLSKLKSKEYSVELQNTFLQKI